MMKDGGQEAEKVLTEDQFGLRNNKETLEAILGWGGSEKMKKQ